MPSLKKRICIIGGGNIGMALAAVVGQNTHAEIVLLTSKYATYTKTITCIDSNSNSTIIYTPSLITDNYTEALSNSDIIFITIPAFLIHTIIDKIFLTKAAIIILTPGSGGREFHFRDLAKQGHLILGLDRAPFIARISKPGNTVEISKKPKVRFSLFKNNNFPAEELLTWCLGIRSKLVSNYLNIVFTPSNQILHTSRLYALLSKKKDYDSFRRKIKFYADWDDLSSKYLLTLDIELQDLCKAYNLLEVIPVGVHYESDTIQQLTEKIKSITSWADIDVPCINKNKKYFIDTESRYFKEDFPFGLCIIKDFALIANVQTPMIDEILTWYSNYMGLEFFVNGAFCGKDLANLSLPRNFKIYSTEDVYQYYSPSVSRHINNVISGESCGNKHT